MVKSKVSKPKVKAKTAKTMVKKPVKAAKAPKGKK